MSKKISTRFYSDMPIRAVYDEESSRWLFSVIDVIGAIRNEDNYEKNRNYWKYLKAKLKKENSEVVSATNQLKLTAPDGKKHLTDVLNAEQVIELAHTFPGSISTQFTDWFLSSDDSIDGKSKSKAYSLFDTNIINSIEVGTVKGLQQIHSYLFDGLYPFAGQIRTVNLSKGDFTFAPWIYLDETLKNIEKMKEDTLTDIVSKYVEMNIAHPFREGNGRSTRIWLDLILKNSLGKCVDWSKIDKEEYLNAMRISHTDSGPIYHLIEGALTDKINDREVYMKGIDYSYYYEE